MFDLEIGEDAKKAQRFVPEHPNPLIGTSHGVALFLHGKHSPQYRDAVAATMRRQKKGDLSLEDTITESARFIATCCEDYEGAKDENGKAKKFNRKELAETLASEDYRWMRVACERFMAEDDNFFSMLEKK